MDGYEKDWDSYATRISERKEAVEWRVLKEARQSHWDEFFHITAGEKILDAGCGHGDYTVYALKEGARVWAFDYSREMVGHASARLKVEGLSAEAVTIDSVLAIPYAENMFDHVFCLAVLDHLSEKDQQRAMQELRRVLKPGGMLYLDVPNRYAYHWRTAFNVMRFLGMYPAGKIMFFSPQRIKNLIRRSGFKYQNSLGLTISPPFSGIYTTDLQRLTIFPEPVIKRLDTLFLKIEANLRRHPFFIPFCWHHFIKAQNPK